MNSYKTMCFLCNSIKNYLFIYIYLCDDKNSLYSAQIYIFIRYKEILRHHQVI